jgi:hypothetical protein
VLPAVLLLVLLLLVAVVVAGCCSLALICGTRFQSISGGFGDPRLASKVHGLTELAGAKRPSSFERMLLLLIVMLLNCYVGDRVSSKWLIDPMNSSDAVGSGGSSSSLESQRSGAVSALLLLSAMQLSTLLENPNAFLETCVVVDDLKRNLTTLRPGSV